MTPTVRTGRSTSKRLPDFVVEAGLADFIEEDGVGLLQDLNAFGRDGARECGSPGPGPRKWMAANEGGRQAELDAQRPHLVLEKFAQGLDQLQLHRFRQATDIVVALDHGGGAAAG